MASDKRVKVTLACEVCKRRNYITMKNKTERPRADRDEEVLPLGPRRTRSTRRRARQGRRARPALPERTTPHATTRWTDPHALPGRTPVPPPASTTTMPAELAEALAALVALARDGDRAAFERARPGDVVGHLQPRPTPRRQRGGREGRGAGGLPAGLPRHRDASGATPVHHLAATGSRPTARRPTSAAAAGTATRSCPTTT